MSKFSKAKCEVLAKKAKGLSESDNDFYYTVRKNVRSDVQFNLIECRKEFWRELVCDDLFNLCSYSPYNIVYVCQNIQVNFL